MPRYSIESASFNLAAATAKTVAQLVTGSTRRGRLIEVGVGFPSVTSTDAPVLLEYRVQSTAGTSSAFTPVSVDPADTAAISTARNTFTAEPTDVSMAFPPTLVTPIGGLYVYSWDVPLFVAISTRLGVRLTSPAAQTGCRAWMVFEE